MKKTATLVLTAVCLFVLNATAFAAQTITVKATVESGTGAIQAVLKPVEFTVPAGKTATIKKFYFSCPKSGSVREKLGKNIYCITTNKYMVDAQNNPIMTLPPGKYRFFVGGYPGAYGLLTYELTP